MGRFRRFLSMASAEESQVTDRVKQVRIELFGVDGGPLVARSLGIPWRTWAHYEAGMTMPATVMLKFIQLTSVEPGWLLNGNGPKYRSVGSSNPPSNC